MKGKHVKTGPKLYNEITNRNVAAKMIQLRMGHCGLNNYLHHFGIKNMLYCECRKERKQCSTTSLSVETTENRRKKLR